MTNRAFYTRSWFLGLVLVAVGALMLLPGLGSFGLWEPPDSWEVIHQRRVDGVQDRKTKRDRYSRPRSELLLAEQARRDVQGAPKQPPVKKAGAHRATKKVADPVKELPPRPPLNRALVGLGYRTFGVSEAAGRVPFALIALLTLALTFLILWRLFDGWTGLLGGLVLLGVPAFVLQARQLTSDMVVQACGVMAVGGLGLWVAPVKKRAWWALPLAAVGLVAGFFARGAIIGVLLPAAVVLLAMVACWRTYRPVEVGGGQGQQGALPPWRFWVEGGVLAALCLGLIIAAIVVLAGQHHPTYSSLLGETPISVTRVLNFHEDAKTNPDALPVFDVMIRQVGFAAFPWVAMLPMAFALLLRRGSRAVATGVSRASEAQARSGFGHLLIASWVLVSVLVGTYWILRFGDLSFPALPALAAAVAVLLMDVLREKDGPVRTGAVAVGVAVIAILVRDFGEFPEALVTTHIHYQLRYPAELAYKWPLRLMLATFWVGIVALFAARGARSPVTTASWSRGRLLAPTRGLARMLGLPDTPGGPSHARPVQAVVVLFFLALAGGGFGWIVQRRPHAGLVIGVAVATVLLLPVLPHLFMAAVDPVLHFLQVLWRLTRDRWDSGMDVLMPTGELDALRQGWQRYTSAPTLSVVLLALPMAIVAGSWALRLVGRVLLLLPVLGLLFLPVTVYAVVRRFGRHESWPRLDRLWAGSLVVAGLGFSVWLAFVQVPRLSHHFSYKAIIESFDQSHDASKGEPLLLWQVRTRSPVFYTQGPLLQTEQVRRRYAAQRGKSSLLRTLAEGWTNAKGAHVDRVYAIVPVEQLGTLDRDAHAAKPPIRYYVLDDRNSFYLLLSNRLGRVRRGGAWVKEKDLNPLRRVVLDQAPRIECPGKRNATCRRVRVELGQSKGTKTPSVELLGARYPKVISPGQKFTLVLYFHVLEKIRGKYKVFVHIDGRGNRILADHDPVGGKYGTPLWLPGQYVVDRYEVPSTVSSSVSTPRGWYTLYVGLFQGEKRMQVISGPSDKKNRVILGRVRVGGGGLGCGN